MTTKTTNDGDDVVRYEIELTDKEAAAIASASEALHQQGETTLLLDPDSRYTLAGNTLVKISDQLQAAIDRNRPLEVGDKVRYAGVTPTEAIGEVLAIRGEDIAYTCGTGIAVATAHWLVRA